MDGGNWCILSTYLGMVYLGMCVFLLLILHVYGHTWILVNSWYIFVCYLFCVVILGTLFCHIETMVVIWWYRVDL